jgi:glycosyltransferase involved in cell wall biosynthesis
MVGWMRNDPEVSCVIPVFNGARFLGEAIESVLAQQGCDVEIIVVDDGSTDGTKGVAHQFDARVSYIWQPNAGTCSARNRGIERSSGEFVALLDSDDLWRPEKMTIQLARFDARPELSICTGSMRNFWSDDMAQELATLPDGRLTEIQPNLGSSFVARRSLFATVGLLDTRFKHRDIQEFILRAVDDGAVAEALPDVLVNRRIHGANVSRNRQDEGDLELLAIARARIARRRGPAA